MMRWDAVDLGDLLLGVALIFSSLIVCFEFLERRRESRRERRVLEAIDAEYQAYYRMGLL
jgi:hypothetical protein